MGAKYFFPSILPPGIKYPGKQPHRNRPESGIHVHLIGIFNAGTIAVFMECDGMIPGLDESAVFMGAYAMPIFAERRQINHMITKGEKSQNKESKPIRHSRLPFFRHGSPPFRSEHNHGECHIPQGNNLLKLLPHIMYIGLKGIGSLDFHFHQAAIKMQTSGYRSPNL